MRIVLGLGSHVGIKLGCLLEPCLSKSIVLLEQDHYSIETTWTSIKPVTTQFAVGRNRSVTVVRKQFPLRSAAAKTIHRSQGDTETQIVVILDTKKAIPHIHM